MKYYGYCIIIAAFLVMYFSMMFALRCAMDEMIKKRFNNDQQLIEEFYEQSAINGIQDYSNAN